MNFKRTILILSSISVLGFVGYWGIEMYHFANGVQKDWERMQNFKYPSDTAITESFLDSLKSVCQENKIDTFDIERLQTDDFSQMAPIDNKLFKLIYPNRDDFNDSTFYIYSYVETGSDYLFLITYQKNHEGEDYRVDYIDLVNIDSNGNQIDKIRLSAKDNAVLTYEVKSVLSGNRLVVNEQFSSEQYDDFDTLYREQFTFELNGARRIDTIDVKSSFEVRRY